MADDVVRRWAAARGNRLTGVCRAACEQVDWIAAAVGTIAVDNMVSAVCVVEGATIAVGVRRVHRLAFACRDVGVVLTVERRVNRTVVLHKGVAVKCPIIVV